MPSKLITPGKGGTVEVSDLFWSDPRAIGSMGYPSVRVRFDRVPTGRGISLSGSILYRWDPDRVEWREDYRGGYYTRDDGRAVTDVQSREIRTIAEHWRNDAHPYRVTAERARALRDDYAAAEYKRARLDYGRETDRIDREHAADLDRIADLYREGVRS